MDHASIYRDPGRIDVRRFQRTDFSWHPVVCSLDDQRQRSIVGIRCIPVGRRCVGSDDVVVRAAGFSSIISD
jgi:hypothetical protein